MWSALSGSIRFYAFLLLSTVAILACSQLDSNNGSGTGSVHLLLTDGPTADFDQVNVSVDSIQLIGNGPGIYLLTEPLRFNLLDLRNASTMLAVNDAVPVGTYSKLRLDVSGIELVKLNNDGSVAETITPVLPSGRIDLNAQSPFTVAPGGDLVVQLDIDANASIEITTTGNDKYIFRPQVFVDVVSDATSSLIRLSGTALDVQPESFQLCRQAALVVDKYCTLVSVNLDSTVMTGDITPSDYSNVVEGDSVLVFGHLDGSAKHVDAVRVFDDTTVLPSFAGVFTSDAVLDSIDFEISKDAPGVTIGDTLPVTPLTLPVVYDSNGTPLDVAAVANGATAEVIGVLQPDAVTPTSIRPGLIIIEVP